jgi:catalase
VINLVTIAVKNMAEMVHSHGSHNISNLVDALKVCRAEIQDKMIEYFTKADGDYGKQVKDGLAKALESRTHRWYLVPNSFVETVAKLELKYDYCG